MINRQLSFSDNMTEHLIASGVTIENEGAVLVSVLEDGVEKVKLGTGTVNEEVVGFAWSNAIVPGTVVATKTETADAAYDAGKFTIALPNAVVGSLRVTQNGETLNDDEYNISADGILTINVAVKENDVFVVIYRKNLTVAEQTALFGNARPNLNNNLAMGSVTVIRGNGQIVTDQFDTSADWSSATHASVGANGLLEPDGAGVKVGRITLKPTAGNLWLGVAFNLA